MLHTERTDQAYKLLKSYARTPEQRFAVDRVVVDALADNDNEDKVVLALLGCIVQGIGFGNWLWDTPPSAQTVRCPEHGHPHTYGEPRKPHGEQY
jgi:hypothetical protein